MKKQAIRLEQPILYQPGLNQKNEAVISAHFMDKINQNLGLRLYTDSEFSGCALTVTSEWLFNGLIPSLLQASEHFVLERVAAVKIRARKNFKEYGLNTANQVGVSEIIAETMFDRQFLKGPKSNYSRLILAQNIKELVRKQQPIKMVIPALPYKSTSPLKTRGVMPDLSEVNFLLCLAEVAKTIALIYSEETTIPQEALAKFTVISDGSRFNSFLNEPIEMIHAYQEKLHWWIDKLNVSNYVEVLDYHDVMKRLLPKEQYFRKQEIREKVLHLYTELMMPIFNPYAIQQMFSKAIELDPDPETNNVEGRFIPLFKSLIYTVRYKSLLNYAQVYGKNYFDLYTEIIRHIFQPYVVLKPNDIEHIKAYMETPQRQLNNPTHHLEYLRQLMLQEAWQAAINYIAEIRGDRDLSHDPIVTCFPEFIRWTIHAKLGQLAILTTTGIGDPVQPWQGAAVFKLTSNNKIKLYTLPALLLEGTGAIPVLLAPEQKQSAGVNQPLFYINLDITFKDSDDLLHQITRSLTRKRKL